MLPVGGPALVLDEPAATSRAGAVFERFLPVLLEQPTPDAYTLGLVLAVGTLGADQQADVEAAVRKGRAAIEDAIKRLAQRHHEHVDNYGHRLEERLTGLHETCDINTFRWGVANRGASIRVPQTVALKGYGYLEDRRPGANADPYRVAEALISTVCGAANRGDESGVTAVAA